MDNPIVLSLLISMAIQAFFFAFAATLKTDKVTDLSYGLTFIILAWYWLLQASETAGVFELALTAMITIWGVRLASYLLIRILKTGRDKRFDEMRDKPLRFARFWLLQGVSVWLIMMPAIYLLESSPNLDAGALPFIGAGIFTLGLVIETFADAQLYKFRFQKENKGKWIDEGLWHYSRHPNYFGEMLVWWGLWVYGTGFYTGIAWLTIVGPVFITILLRYISGIPLLQKAAEKKWGDDENYKKYKESTHLLVPIPKK